jgi:hypothetical protein
VTTVRKNLLLQRKTVKKNDEIFRLKNSFPENLFHLCAKGEIFASDDPVSVLKMICWLAYEWYTFTPPVYGEFPTR